jgi:hypothetical protein
MASTVSDTCAVYNARVRRPKVDEQGYMLPGESTAVGLLGDCEHLRPCVQHQRRLLQAGDVMWMTDTTLHESLPLPSSATLQRRQFFRLVTSNIGAWYAAHNTPNPLGTVPPIHIPIITENKYF